jgi:hypothetical protein
MIAFARPAFPLACLFLVCFLTGQCRADFQTGLLAYYPFNGNTLDYSGNGRDLMLVGNPGFALGMFGQALVLDGTANQYAIRPVSDSVFDFGSGDFTVQAWVNFNPRSSIGEQTIIEKLTGTGGPGWSLTTPSFTHYQFFDSTAVALNGGSPTTGVWLDVIVERSGNLESLFVDGNLVVSKPTIGALLASPNPLLIGRRNLGDPRNFAMDGAVDDVAIWDRALTANEIATLWNGGQGTPVLAPPSPAPAPASLTLCVIGLAILAGYGWLRRTPLIAGRTTLA